MILVWLFSFWGEMCICLACLLVTGSWSVAVCDDSVVLPYGSLSVCSFYIITGVIVFWVV